jgi:hypothetical protein
VSGGATYLAASGLSGSHLPWWPIVIFGAMLGLSIYVVLALSWDLPLPGRRRYLWEEDHEVVLTGDMRQAYIQESAVGHKRNVLKSAYKQECRQARKRRWDRLLRRGS